MKKKIAIYTSARSDYGLMRRLIQLSCEKFDVDILLAGNHHSPSSGLTRTEVEADAVKWPVRLIPIEFMVDGTSDQARLKSLALAQSSLAQWLSVQSYDAMVVLGDRWELFGASLACLLFGIPLAHISGGEVTEGVIDDSVRHAHTKLAHLHFAANDIYARNLSHMGEEDWRIVICGECGLDSIHLADLATDAEIAQRFGIDLARPSILVTYHPSTLDFETPVGDQIGALLRALEQFPDHQVILTGPGAEKGSDLVLEALMQYVDSHSHARFVSHFGSRNYLAVLKKASLVLGNSSSGLVEASSFGVPTVNVGDRQKNRLCADSVLHVGYDCTQIQTQIAKALSPEFQEFSRSCINPYDPYRDGRNSQRIVQALASALELPKDKLLVKKFDLDIHSNDWNTLLENFA